MTCVLPYEIAFGIPSWPLSWFLLNRIQGQALERLRADSELDNYQPYTVQYLKGDKMPADGLSRHHLRKMLWKIREYDDLMNMYTQKLEWTQYIIN